MKRLAAGLLLITLGGCFPYALPPAEMEAGPCLRRDHRSDETSYDIPASLELAVNPLQVVPKLQERRFDVGAGAFTFVRPGARFDAGVLAELGALPLVLRHDEGLLRLATRLQGRWVFDTERGWGPGAAAQVAFEYALFDRGGGSGGAIGYGERGIGIYAEATTARIGALHLNTFSVGVAMRIPATVGIAFLK